MAANGSGHMPSSFALRSGLPTFGNFGNALLERGNPGLRKSTPDSEALASSDEEVEQSRLRSVAQRKAQSTRRSSLLAEQTQDSKRHSFVGNSVYGSTAGSQPNTPSGSTDNWSTMSPNLGTWNSGAAYPFGANIWGTKETNASRHAESQRQENAERHNLSNPSLSNTPAHRSLSFSVGQSEHESQSSNTSTPADTASRPSQYLTRRSSRQSNLTSDLERVDEIEHSPVRPGGIGQGRMQPRAMSSASAQFRAGGLRSSINERSELAIDDNDESQVQSRVPIRNAPSRRLSDIQTINSSRGAAAVPFSTTSFLRSSRDNLHWSSGADMATLETIPASRRHSFADVPTRRGSLGSTEDNIPGHTYEASGTSDQTEQEAWSYKANNASLAQQVTTEVQQQLKQDHEQAVFGSRNTYGIPITPSSIGSFHGPSSAPLFVVNFKLCRSEIFYIQDGTGLVVQEGDLVIVEADRGYDLGCVQHAQITWEAARKYKVIYAEQQFQWLMMFSHQARSGASNLFNPNAVAPGRGGPSVPGGPGSRDAEIKPKLIKRLAQPHEIQALQDKEGNEAKAKRMCQQKVTEHNLNMEILDAEFQMDGKKLTFYFFSTEYINFNPLVTDLFKLYKTRIWMSAINPASFQSPVAQLGLTPIYGNAGLGVSNATASSANMYEEPRGGDQRYFNSGQAHQIQPRGMPQLYLPGYGQAGQVNPFNQFGAAEHTGVTHFTPPDPINSHIRMAHFNPSRPTGPMIPFDPIGAAPSSGQVNQQVNQAFDYSNYPSNQHATAAPTESLSRYNAASNFRMPAQQTQNQGAARGPGLTQHLQTRNEDSFAEQFRALNVAQ